MSQEIDELKLDLEELKSLLTQVKRRKNKTFLNNQIATLENKINNAPQPGIKDFTPTNPTPSSSQQARSTFSPIERYGFDQDEDKVTVYITSLPSIVDTCQHSFECTEQSFDLRLYNVEGKNYRLSFAKLDGPIDKEKSTCVIKNGKVVLTLYKTSERTWLQLHYQKQVGEDFNPESDDPAKGLMNMMQELYNTGDDKVKRQIAKVWSNSELGREDRRN